MQAYIGQLLCVGFNFAPRGWLLCQGQLLPIQQYTALFSLLGTMYGGDGKVTFGLPDLRGRIPLGFGQSPGLQNYVQGQTAGTETVTLAGSQLPAHGHNVAGAVGEAESTSPVDQTFAAAPAYSTTPNSSMSPATIAPSGGGSQPHDNRQPYLVINWVICTSGIFPPHQ